MLRATSLINGRDFPDMFNLWSHTLPETNIAPENGWLEYEFPLGMAHFQGGYFSTNGFGIVGFGAPRCFFWDSKGQPKPSNLTNNADSCHIH